MMSWRLYISKTNDKEVTVGVKWNLTSDFMGGFNQIVSLLNWVRFPEGNLEISYANLVLTPERSQTVLKSIPLSQIVEMNSALINASLSLEVYFQLSYMTAGVLQYVRERFGTLTTRSDTVDHPISTLSTNELSLLLSDKSLNVKSEDEVVDALQTWLHANFNAIDEKTLVDDILKHVVWSIVSFERLTQLYKTFPRLCANIHTKTIFQNQIKSRASSIPNPNCKSKHN